MKITQSEWELKLTGMLNKHPMFKLSNPLSINELVYMLRNEEENYNLNILTDKKDWLFIPSAKETFVPTRTLAQKIIKIEVDDFEDACCQNTIFLNIHTKEVK